MPRLSLSFLTLTVPPFALTSSIIFSASTIGRFSSKMLQGQIEIPLNICGVNYIDYPVGLAVEYKVSRNYLLLCIRSYRIDTGKVDNGAVF